MTDMEMQLVERSFVIAGALFGFTGFGGFLGLAVFFVKVGSWKQRIEDEQESQRDQIKMSYKRDGDFVKKEVHDPKCENFQRRVEERLDAKAKKIAALVVADKNIEAEIKDLSKAYFEESRAMFSAVHEKINHTEKNLSQQIKELAIAVASNKNG